MTIPVPDGKLDVSKVADDVAKLLANPPTAAISTTGLNAFLSATETKWTATSYPPDEVRPFQAWFRLASVEYAQTMSLGAGDVKVFIRAAVVLQFERRSTVNTWTQMARFLSPDAVQALLTTDLPTSGASCVCMAGEIVSPEASADTVYGRLEFELEIRS